MISGFQWRVPARVIRWKDADTCEVDLDLGWRFLHPREAVRPVGLWSPERKDLGGPEATAHANLLCPPGTIVQVTSKALGVNARWTPGGQESLSRTLGDILLPGGRDFVRLMIDDGFGAANR